MKLTATKIIALLFLPFIPIFALGNTPAQALPEDAILAVVNDDVITYRDLAEYLKSRSLQLKLEGVPESEIRSMMADLEANGIRRLIQDKLVISEANRKQIQVRKPVLDDRIKNIRMNYPSEDVFLLALAQDGLTISDLRKKIEDQIKAQQVIQTEVKDKIYINPQEITDYYNQNLTRYQKPDRISLDSIFIAKGGDPVQAHAKAQEALTKIKSGEEFRAVAESYSETPAIGTVEKGKLLPQIENNIWPLEVGQTTDVIDVANGYYIFKVLGKTPTSTASLDEVKDSIQKIIFDQKLREGLEKWLTRLEKDAFVEIKNEDESM